MSDMRKFINILNESNDDVHEKFGKILFGSLFNTEPDTNHEKNVFNMLQDYMHINSPSGDLEQALKYLHQHKSLFPEVLEPNATKVYRGLFLEPEQAVRFPDTGESLKYTPVQQIESWTTDHGIALQFATNLDDPDLDEESIALIVEAQVDDAFIFNADFTDEITHGEQEIIRIGASPMNVKVVLKDLAINHIDAEDF